MEENTHIGTFKVVVYFENMQYPVQAEVSFNDKEAESIRRAVAEHNTDEDWPDLYDLEPSLAMQLRQAFLDQCPEEFLMNAEMLEFDYLEFPEEFTQNKG